jgi:hypothetical protein
MNNMEIHGGGKEKKLKLKCSLILNQSLEIVLESKDPTG